MGAYVTDFDDCPVPDVPLDAERVVVDGRGLGVNLDCIQRSRSFQRCADEVGQVVNRAEINRYIALEGRIADEVSARRPTAGARAVVNAEMTAQHRLATFKKAQGKAEARLHLKSRRVFEPAGDTRVGPNRDAVELIARVEDECTDQGGIGEEFTCNRVLGAPVGVGAGGRSRRSTDAEGAIEQRRLCRIEERRVEVRSVEEALRPL